MTHFHSRLLGENGKITDDESVIFDSGITFTEAELRVIRTESRETIQALCFIKEIFGGNLEYCGKATEGYESPRNMQVFHTQVAEPVKTVVSKQASKDSEQLTFDMLMR